jgi:NCS1 family nucleobase:cation symporter-1
MAPGRDPSLYNEDLAPVPQERRTWGTYNYASLWVAMSVCIPTYMLASGLIAGGMSWWQAIGTILLGNLIVLVPMLLNAHAGTRYGIPFPVFVRASFGVRGANIPAASWTSTRFTRERAPIPIREDSTGARFGPSPQESSSR